MTPASTGTATTAILFDVTGTLIRLHETVGETYARFGREDDVDLPAWRLDDAFKRVLRHVDPRVFPDASADEIAALEERWWAEVVRSTFLATDSTARFNDPPTFYARLYRHYAGAAAWDLVPGARALLVDLHARKLRLGIVSNFDQRLLEVLDALDITGFFEIVMIPALSRCEKPDPAIFQAALALLDLPAESVIFVGDDPEKDLAAAKRVGMSVIDVGAVDDLAALAQAIENPGDDPAS